MWTTHKRYNCPVCSEYGSDKRGRPKDIKRLGRPKKVSNASENAFTKLFDNTVDTNVDIEIQNMSEAQIKSFKCEYAKMCSLSAL